MQKLALTAGLVALLLHIACGDTEQTTDGPASTDIAVGSDQTTDGPPTDLPAGGDGPADDSKKPLQPDECSAAKPDWVFCSSFEEGHKNIWDDYDGNPDATNKLMADPGPFNLSANHVMRLRVPPGRGGADLVKELPSQHDKLYARWYIKWEQGYDFDAKNHGGGLHAGARNYLGRSDNRPQGDDWFTAWIEPLPKSKLLNIYSYYRGMYMDCANPSGSCWGDHFPCMVGSSYCTKPEHTPTVTPQPLVADRWYCIELMMDGGTATSDGSQADGQLNFWIDGQAIGPWTKLWLRTDAKVKVSILWLSLFHHDAHSVEGVMYDNVVVSKSRVGCL